MDLTTNTEGAEMSVTGRLSEAGIKQPIVRSRLRRIEASEYLMTVWGVSYTPKTLATLACTGGGPSFQKAGRFPLYPIAELDRWVESRLGELKSSTSA